tara:strand:+ start:262 stop:504 length:243 start_codon:yes stop_codon:yes gene_type:complete
VKKRDNKLLTEKGNNMHINDLDAETIAKLGLTKEAAKPREYKFTKDQVRSNAMNVMAVISKLSQNERRRVLEHCMKINEV